MGLLTKRLQQGVWEALASQNRMAGSGGGTGLRPGFIAGLTTSAGFVTGITNAAWKTIASVICQGRPHLVDAILLELHVRYQQVSRSFSRDQVGEPRTPLSSGGCCALLQRAPNDNNARAGLVLKGYLLAVGSNTINLRATVTGDTFECQGTISVAMPS